MGKGKRRNTANTGDKSLYKKAAEAREKAAAKSSKQDDGDEHMYDDVDQYHNKKDKEFMKFDEVQGSESEEEVEAVMDLGVGGDSSSEDEDSDDSDLENQGNTRQQQDMSSSSDEDDEDIEDVRDWGKKKSVYYHGDTADLEIGQEEEDAFLEEEAAKEVQAARYEEMEEADFMLSDDDEDTEKNSSKENLDDDDKETMVASKVSSIRDISKLTSKDRKKLLEKQHPGLLQILSHFSESVQNLKDRTSVATKALFEGVDDDTAEAIGATKAGQKYLLTKAMLESSTALNLAMFLLLKSKETSNEDHSLGETSSSVHFHPVMKRLQGFNVLNQNLKGRVEEKVAGLHEQMDSLMKAAEMMASMAPDEAEEEEEGSEARSAKEGTGNTEGGAMIPSSSPAVASSPSDDESSVDEEARARSAIHDARFGVRPNEMVRQERTTKRKRRLVPSDVGDDGDATNDRKGASMYLSSAINSIEQRAASKKMKKRVVASEELVERREANDELRRGLQMMEEELGKASDEEGDDAAAYADDMDSNGDDGFYSSMAKKSKRKKAIKKSLYQVAHKYPKLAGEIEGERAISRTIMKNRGLVPHKNKLNRNPRVKKREQYRKALIRRKGTVREVRTDEGHKYGGEETGIKRGISRSRKLGAN